MKKVSNITKFDQYNVLRRVCRPDIPPWPVTEPCIALSYLNLDLAHFCKETLMQCVDPEWFSRIRILPWFVKLGSSFLFRKAQKNVKDTGLLSAESGLQLLVYMIFGRFILFNFFRSTGLRHWLYVEKGRSRMISRVRIRLGHQVPDLSGSTTLLRWLQIRKWGFPRKRRPPFSLNFVTVWYYPPSVL